MILRKTIIAITLILSVYAGNSQESIPYDSIKLTIGDINYIVSSDYIGTGDSGENVMWDFSSLNKISVSEIRVLAADSSFGGSNITRHNITENSYQYLFQDSTKLELIATKEGNPEVVSMYPRGLNFTNYPIEYGAIFKDTALMTYYDNNLQDSARGTIYTDRKVDAFGTLTTPHGTFENVLRVHSNWKVSIKYTAFTIEYEIDLFEWYGRGFSTSLLNVTITNVNGNLTYTTYYLDDPELNTMKLDTPKSDVLIYPNPTSDYLNVRTNWNNFSIVIYDITGKNVYKGNDNNINISSLHSGIYTVVVSNLDNSTSYTQKIVVER